VGPSRFRLRQAGRAYIAFCVLLFWLSGTGTLARYAKTPVLYTWLLLSVSAVAVVAYFLSAVLLTVISLGWASWYVDPVEVSMHLLELLHDLEGEDPLGPLASDGRNRALRSIAKISGMIGLMYETNARNPAALWTSDEMNHAADNFLSLSAWVYFPQPGTLENLKREVCRYVNIFLSGYFHKLPRQAPGPQACLVFQKERARALGKALWFGVFLLYTVLPILVASVLLAIFHTSVPQALQSALPIVYLIWLGYGLFSFAEKFDPEARTFLADVLKSVLGRKG
jgi:hypothetical protein